MKPYEKLRGRWAQTDPTLRVEAVPEQALLSLEQRYGIALPGDFREYLAHCAPERDGSWDDGTCWWHMERIKSLSDESENPISNPDIAGRAKELIVFADYLVWCMAWAIDCGSGAGRGEIVLISGEERVCAASFAEFVDQHMKDVQVLL